MRRTGIEVAIYPTRNRIYRTGPNGEKILNGDHPQFTVAWYEAGERRKRKFADQDYAKRHAQQTLARLSRGHVEIVAVSAADRQLLADLRALSTSVGRTDILGFVRDACDAINLLPAKVTLREAAAFFPFERQWNGR